MPKFFKQLGQSGVIHLIPLLLVLVGIIAGVYLVQHPTIFKPKASEIKEPSLLEIGNPPPLISSTSQGAFGVLQDVARGKY